MNYIKFIFNILFFFNFTLLIKSYDLDLSPISRNVLCYFNVNKNCSKDYRLNKDKELFFLNDKNSITNEHSILEESKKNRWVYLDHYIYETSKYFVVPFALPYKNINKVFIFFPNKKVNEDENISFKTLNSSNVCYNFFYKSNSKFSCIFDKDDLDELLNKKISLYVVINFKTNITSTIVFDVILKKSNISDEEFISYSEYIDKYNLPNNFEYKEYMNIKEKKTLNKKKDILDSNDITNKTNCEKTLNLEKCYKEKYLIDPCNKSNFYYCFMKNNHITKTKLYCSNNLVFNNIFKFCEY